MQINVKCVPLDKNWAGDREMHTTEFGSFIPGEIKRVNSSPKVDKLLNSGEFEIVDEDPNSDEIRKQAATLVRLQNAVKTKIAEENAKPAPVPATKSAPATK